MQREINEIEHQTLEKYIPILMRGIRTISVGNLTFTRDSDENLFLLDGEMELPFSTVWRFIPSDAKREGDTIRASYHMMAMGVKA